MLINIVWQTAYVRHLAKKMLRKMHWVADAEWQRNTFFPALETRQWPHKTREAKARASKWNSRGVKLVLSLHHLSSIGVLHLQQLSGQLVHHGNLGGCSVHLMVKAVKAVFHDGQLLYIVCHHDGGQELLLRIKGNRQLSNQYTSSAKDTPKACKSVLGLKHTVNYFKKKENKIANNHALLRKTTTSFLLSHGFQYAFLSTCVKKPALLCCWNCSIQSLSHAWCAE